MLGKIIRTAFGRHARVLTIGVLVVFPSVVPAQWMISRGSGLGDALGAPVGGDVERLVRAMMVAGTIEMLPWSARPLSAADLQILFADSSMRGRPIPWRNRRSHASGLQFLGPSLVTSWNSGYPWGANDGAIAAGRGSTSALGLGVAGRFGPLTLIVAPSVILSQNAAFPLLTRESASDAQYRDGQFADFVDRPQRFGGTAYATFDLSQTQLRADFKYLSVGAGTENVGWGTSEQFAPVLGPNAAGFVHGFIGTPASGIRLEDFGTIAVRYLSGRLEQSSYSPVRGSRTFQSIDEPGTVRLATGLAASWLPAFAPQLELGATRLFISPFFTGARKWRTLRKPFEGVFKSKRERSNEAPGDELGDLDNQLGTLYARWRLPKRGAEFSLEWLREDNSFDSRDLAQEPEQNAAIVAGFRVATERSVRRLGMLTVELFDGDIAPIGRQRDQGNLYIHIPLRQGATNRGQLLGAPIGVGAVSGQRIEWERFDSTGSWRVNAERWNQRFQRNVSVGSLVFDAQNKIAASRQTVFDLGVTRLLLRPNRPAFSLGAGLGVTEAFNFADRRLNFRLNAAVRGW